MAVPDHRTNPLCDGIPDLVGLTHRIEARQVHDADKLKVDGIAVIVLAAMLCGTPPSLGLAEGGPTVSGCKHDDPLFAGAPNVRRTIHHDSKLEQKLRGVTRTPFRPLGVMALRFQSWPQMASSQYGF